MTPLRQLDAKFTAAVSGGDDESIAKCVRNLNRVTSDFHARFCSEILTLRRWPAMERAGDGVPEHALLEVGFAHGLIGRRIAELLLDLIDSLERRRLLVSALTARALLESSALAVYCDEQASSIVAVEPLTEVALRKLVDLLHRVSGGGRYDWLRARGAEEDQLAMLREYAHASSTSKAPEPPEERRAFNVLTMLTHLDRRFAADASRDGMPVGEGVVRACYAMLSDFCHPAIGGALLHARPAADGETLDLRSEAHDRDVRWFFTNFVTFVAPIVRFAGFSLNRLTELAPRIERGA